MDDKLIRYERAGRTAYLTLNRPEKRNALNEDMVGELTRALEELREDGELRAIVLRATGPVFSAGADLGYLERLAANSAGENLEDSRRLMELYQAIYRHPKMTIAQVEGDAIAGGCGLATACDFCFATPEARFGYTEGRIGFIPALVSVLLVARIGEGKARELLLTARLVSSGEALQMGLVSRVVPAATIAAEVRREADELSSRVSGQSVALTKKLLADIRGMTVAEAFEKAATANAEARATRDCQKGIRAFLEKTEIKW
jgi:methylglutaconyl-CoA hydratase